MDPATRAVLMTIFGVLLIAGAYFKWPWMVRGFIVSSLQDILGWNGTRIVLVLLGILFIYIGTSTLLNF